MKKKWILFLLTLLFLLIGFAGVSRAQLEKRLTAVIKTPTVQCQECKERIEKYLSHEEGIQKVNVDYKKKTATVTYLTDRTNVENIKALIANTGYDADDVTAPAGTSGTPSMSVREKSSP